MPPKTGAASAQTTPDQLLAPKPQEVRVRAGPPRLPRSTCGRRDGADGAIEGRSGQGMDLTKEHPQSTQVSGFHRVLSLLHPRVLSNHPTSTRPHQASNDMALGRQRTSRIQNALRQNGQQTGPTATQLRQNLLSPNRRVQVWSRGGPIPRRRNKRSNPTKTTPRHILLRHLLPHGTKLRCP